MAITYPGTIDSFTDPSGTQTLASPDHAGMHTDVHSALEIIETVLGTTTGTAVIKHLPVGKFAAPTAGGTITTSLFSAGTLSTATITSGTLSGVLLGTSTITGGTASAMLIGTSTITGGTAGAVTLGTPIMDFFTSSGTTLPTKANRGLAPTVGTLADSPAGTITPNAAVASVFEITLGTTVGTRTIGTPINPTDGQAINFRIKNNAAATGTLVFASIYRFTGGSAEAPVLGGSTSAWNYYGFRYNLTDVKWDAVGNSKNII
jgi:hypothetical protein